jgi:uncharacterized membrane protein YfcA
VNIFSGFSWLWRALRGKSVTFAMLFATSMLGVSVLGWFRHLLDRWGAPWYLLFILPIVLVTVLSRKEEEWLPDPELRMRCARWLVFSSIVVVVLTGMFRSEQASIPSSTPSESLGRARIERN